jgi:hypothetical protein
MPQTIDEALKIAIAVSQAEVQERRNEAFYVEEARGAGAADRLTHDARCNGTGRRAIQHTRTGRTQSQVGKGPARNLGNRKRAGNTGIQEVEFYLNDRRFCHHFCVCLLPTHADGIVGMDFLSERNADLNMGNLELRLLKGSNFLHGPVGQRIWQPRSETGSPDLTVFITQNSRHIREGTKKQEGKPHPQQFELREAESWIVKTMETDRLAPRVKQIVIGRVETPKRQARPELVW